MNVILIGSGAREHAIAWKLRQSVRLNDLFAAPGNTGTQEFGVNLNVRSNDIEGIVRACKDSRVDLAVVGNEEPLAAGLVDRLAVEGIAAFGPTKAAAEIEWSKAFSKGLMARHGIPTAPFAIFDDHQKAREFIEQSEAPFVIKADGLALGKGVVVTNTQAEALQALEAAMSGRMFGPAGSRVVIEERLLGREVSAHAFADGETVRHMPFSCDHKPVFDGDRGPNTGGMGAYSPATWLTDEPAQTIRGAITEAALAAMADEGRPYRGALYPGIMVTNQGPMVIEFNSRFGDPEAQVLLPQMDSDLLEVLWATATRRLHEIDIKWSEEACVAVVVASGGYPGDFERGFPIKGLDDLDQGVLVFHAGTSMDERGRLVTAGGRVLTIVAMGATMEEARANAYRNVERVRFEGVHYRRDIGAAATATAVGADER